MSERFITYKPESLTSILYWLNSLVGLTLTSGTVTRIIDWQLVPTGCYGEYEAIVRVEMQS